MKAKKGGSSGTKPEPKPAEVAQAKVVHKNPEIESYKNGTAVKKPCLCTPTIDKAGAWSWRGKVLEQIWDGMTQGAEAVEKTVPGDPPVGGFTERFEARSGDMMIVGGGCRGEEGKDGNQCAFAVVFSAGKYGDSSAVQQLLELPLPLAFVAVHMLTTLHRVFFTRDKVLALLNANATTAIADVKECIGWMRDRLGAVERSPQAILTRCAEIFRTSKEMHAHYLNQESERHRVAKLALERAEKALAKAKDKLAEASDNMHDERAKRYARRERKAEKEHAAQQTADQAAQAKAEAAAAALIAEEEAEGKAGKKGKGGGKKDSGNKGTGGGEMKKGFLANGLGTSKAEANAMSREDKDIAELEALDAKAPVQVERLLTNLRGFASGSVVTDKLPGKLDVLRFLTHCDVVVQCKPLNNGDKGGGKKASSAATETEGRWFVAMGSSKCVPPAPPPAPAGSDEESGEEEEDLEDIDDGKKEEANEEAAAAAAAAAAAEEEEEEEEREEESVAICIAQKKDGTVYGAVGWYELGSLPTNLEGVLSLTSAVPPPKRCMRIDDGSWEGLGFLHMTLQGYGKDASPIVPMGYNLYGGALFHYAAGLADYHVAREQIEVRLSQGRSGMDERNHARTLLDATMDRYQSIAIEANDGKWLPPNFSRCESAVQGLRKTMLRRPWCPRCSQCGVRHEDIEFSTCKFWQAWVV